MYYIGGGQGESSAAPTEESFGFVPIVVNFMLRPQGANHDRRAQITTASSRTKSLVESTASD